MTDKGLNLARHKASDAKPLATKIVLVVTIFGYFAGGNLVEEYALPFISVFILIFLRYWLHDKAEGLGVSICDFSFMAMLLLRANMAVPWMAMCLSLGSLLLLMPIVIWLWRGNALGAFWRDYVRFNLAYSGGQQSDMLARRVESLGSSSLRLY